MDVTLISDVLDLIDSLKTVLGDNSMQIQRPIYFMNIQALVIRAKAGKLFSSLFIKAVNKWI